MCSNLDAFSSYEPVNDLNHYITIPDGTKVQVQNIASVYLGPNITLKNVSHVPGFNSI